MPQEKHSRGNWDAYEPEEELYVYDQCCENCRYYADYCESESGCRNVDREDYEVRPKTHWCCDWKGKREHR